MPDTVLTTKGFTLIELLVAITVMAIVGVFAMANFRSFGQDKELENAALDIQSQIRVAQTNASTNLTCRGIRPAGQWRDDFSKQSNIYKIKLSCNYSDPGNPSCRGDGACIGNEKILVLPPDIIIEKIIVKGSDNTLPNDFIESNSPPYGGGSYAATVFSEPPFAKLSFRCYTNYPSAGCTGGTPDNKFVIQLKNTKTSSTKQVIIEEGGNVYVQ